MVLSPQHTPMLKLSQTPSPAYTATASRPRYRTGGATTPDAAGCGIFPPATPTVPASANGDRPPIIPSAVPSSPWRWPTLQTLPRTRHLPTVVRQLFRECFARGLRNGAAILVPGDFASIGAKYLFEGKRGYGTARNRYQQHQGRKTDWAAKLHGHRPLLRLRRSLKRVIGDFLGEDLFDGFFDGVLVHDATPVVCCLSLSI